MTIYLGADHRGFELKEKLKEWLKGHGYSAEDLGAHKLEPEDDYVDFAVAVAQKVSEGPDAHKGILICGSGQGMAIAANKFKGVYAALCWNEGVAKQSREHGNANVLVLPADELPFDFAVKIVEVWLDTPFRGEERHARRLKKIYGVEGMPHD